MTSDDYVVPEWFWDKTRPAAIIAQEQIEESFRILEARGCIIRPHLSEATGTSGSLAHAAKK